MTEEYSLSIWQASSDPVLTNTSPEDLFDGEFAAQYRELHADIWERMTRLHGTIHVLEELEKLPLDTLFGPNEFWHLFVENFIDTAILLLHTLLTDKNNSHTLGSLQNRIINTAWNNPDLKKRYMERNATNKFDKELKNLERRNENMRHNRVAHRFTDKATGQLRRQSRLVGLKELRKLFDGAHRRFGDLSFGSAFATLTIDMTPPTNEKQLRQDSVTEVLDAVLRSNAFVTLPEREANWWPELRKTPSEASLKLMNELRMRVGLPRA